MDMLHRGDFEMARKYLEFAVEKEEGSTTGNYYKATLAWVVNSPTEAQQLLRESCSAGSNNLKYNLARAIYLCELTGSYELKKMYWRDPLQRPSTTESCCFLDVSRYEWSDAARMPHDPLFARHRQPRPEVKRVSPAECRCQSQQCSIQSASGVAPFFWPLIE